MCLLFTANPKWIKSNPKVKVTKFSIFKNEEKQGLLAHLNQLWYILQKLTKKVNNMVTENYVFPIDS